MSDQSGYVTNLDELRLSNDALIDLMKDVISKDMTFNFQAKGWSMSPFIQDGDMIGILPVVKTSLIVGDVVAYIQPSTGKLVVHRIISIDHEKFHIQGDNHSSCDDEVIEQRDIIGKVSSIKRDGKIINLGLGPEKRLIALFSQKHILQPIVIRLIPLFRPFRRVQI